MAPEEEKEKTVDLDEDSPSAVRESRALGVYPSFAVFCLAVQGTGLDGVSGGRERRVGLGRGERKWGRGSGEEEVGERESWESGARKSGRGRGGRGGGKTV